MANGFKHRTPGSVFTPRGESVTEMYIPRQGLEEALSRSLNQPKNIILHGESGSGKTWLYKSLFQREKIYSQVVNLGSASASCPISNLLKLMMARINPVQLRGYSETKSASVGIPLVGAELEHQKAYEYIETDIFEKALRQIREKAGSKKAVLVFENLEHILDDATLLKELSGYLLLVDDSNYAKHKVKILLVTTASDVRRYLSKSDRSNTIANRIIEIPEVTRLLITQTETFIKKGFFDLLGFQLTDGEGSLSEKQLSDWLLVYSDRIPQFLHELCLEIAVLGEKSGRLLSRSHLEIATLDWVRSSLISELTAVEANLNSRTTNKGRRNQVIYALGRCKEHDFDHSKIEGIVRKEFPIACKDVGLNISQTLAQLADSSHPIIRRVPNSSSYRFIDPKLKIVVRWKIYKDPSDEKLSFRDFDDAIQL